MAKPVLHFKQATLKVAKSDKLDIPATNFVSTGGETNVKIRIWNVVVNGNGAISRGKYDYTKNFKDDFPSFQPVAAEIGINFLHMVAWTTDEPPTTAEPFFSQHTVVLDVQA